MDGERLELARGARVVARDGEVGLLTHAVADRETRAATELVVVHGAVGAVPVARIPVRRERVSDEREQVVVEEVGVGKRTIAGTQALEGTVRREEAVVESQGALVAVTAEEGVAE